MKNPTTSVGSAGSFVPTPDQNPCRSEIVWERLDQVLRRLRDEGVPPEEIAKGLAAFVADAMEREAKPSAGRLAKAGNAGGGEGSVPVDLRRVPNRFSVSALLVLHSLRCAASQPARLGRMLGVSAAAMSGILDTLEARGLVIRERDPEDRRKVQVGLTKKGHLEVAAMFLN
jgi:DNA-binding transcriptional ArsR family regulator